MTPSQEELLVGDIADGLIVRPVQQGVLVDIGAERPALASVSLSARRGQPKHVCVCVCQKIGSAKL